MLDTNGDGEITRGWTEPDEAIDPTRDHRIQFSCYAPAVSPADGSVWCSGIRAPDNKLLRIDVGSNPPESCMAEIFEAPPTATNPSAYHSGGIHITTDGVVWQDWRGSGHFASFDHSLCAVTTGANATGRSCPEGWTFHRIATKPTFQNAEFPINADESYLTQVDHHDVLGLGRDVPLYGVVNTDSLEVFVPDTEQFVTLRVPYPMGFFSRSSNGRIDDPTTGWKGKGLWSSYSNYAAWHLEGGTGHEAEEREVPDPPTSTSEVAATARRHDHHQESNPPTHGPARYRRDVGLTAPRRHGARALGHPQHARKRHAALWRGLRAERDGDGVLDAGG